MNHIQFGDVLLLFSGKLFIFAAEVTCLQVDTAADATAPTVEIIARETDSGKTFDAILVPQTVKLTVVLLTSDAHPVPVIRIGCAYMANGKTVPPYRPADNAALRKDIIGQQENPLNLIFKVPVPQTDTRSRVEYTKALE